MRIAPHAASSARSNPPQVLVISLPTASTRRRFMEAQLDVPGMPPYRFIEGTDGRRLSEAELAGLYDDAAARRLRRPLTIGEIGCAAGHRAAYRDIVANGAQVTLVLEDDALLGVNFLQALTGVVDRMDKAAPQAVLLSHVVRYSAWGGQRVGKRHFIYRPYEAYGAHAYLITASGARALLEAFPRVETVADDWKHFARKARLQVSALVPYLVGTSPLASASQIGEERHEREPLSSRERARKYLWQKLLFQLVVKPALRLRRAEQTW
jgi:glycosyl transferase, family 25